MNVNKVYEEISKHIKKGEAFGPSRVQRFVNISYNDAEIFIEKGLEAGLLHRQNSILVVIPK